MRAVLHAFAVTGGRRFGARQGRRRYAEIVNSPILGEAGPGQRSFEGSRAEVMPGTRDEQSRCQLAPIVLSTSGHRVEVLMKSEPAVSDRSMRCFVSLMF